jgi:acetyl esterase/lipase
MRHQRVICLGILVVLAVLAHASPLPAQQKPSNIVELVYSKVGDRDLKLDLAMPREGKGPFPVVVCVHGGGWRMGNKREMRDWLEAFSKRGFVTASVGYRLAPEYVFPAQIEDCKTAVRFLRANAKAYNIDKDRVAAMGFSAGGHLVCLLGLTDAKAGFEGKEYLAESSKVQAVIDYFGPTDLPAFGSDESAQRSMIGPFIGAKFPENPTAHEKASPVRYVNKESPPFLIFHGTKDWMVPIEQSRLLTNKLKEVGANVKMIEVIGESHGWIGPASRRTSAQTVEFLEEHFKK